MPTLLNVFSTSTRSNTRSINVVHQNIEGDMPFPFYISYAPKVHGQQCSHRSALLDAVYPVASIVRRSKMWYLDTKWSYHLRKRRNPGYAAVPQAPLQTYPMWCVVCDGTRVAYGTPQLSSHVLNVSSLLSLDRTWASSMRCHKHSSSKTAGQELEVRMTHRSLGEDPPFGDGLYGQGAIIRHFPR